MSQVAIAHPPSGTPVMPRSRIGGARLAVETPRLLLRGIGEAGALELAILLKPGLVEAGWLRFSLGSAQARDVGIGFFLEPEHRGCGLMREAVRAATPQALRLLGAKSLYALLPADAPAAHKVAAALGLAPGARRGALRRYEKDLCGLF